MRRVMVKICGLREEAHMVVAASAGVDLVGLVFAESRRRVTPARAEQLRRVLDDMPHPPRTVGVFVDEDAARVNAIAEQCRLDLVQLSGDETPDYIGLMTLPVIKAIRVEPGMRASDVERRMAVLRGTGASRQVTFLLDTGGSASPGGSGLTFDWAVAREVAGRQPVLVAGGLTPLNVAQLIAIARPHGVDVSSGVESDGGKDPSLIRAFVRAVRRAEQENDDATDACAR